MYPIEIFQAILVIDGLLTVYGILSKGADYWKNIVALGFATFLSVYLATVSISGTAFVYSAITNSTSLATQAISDDGLMWIFYIIATIQGIYTLVEGAEAYELYIARKEDRDTLIS